MPQTSNGEFPNRLLKAVLSNFVVQPNDCEAKYLTDRHLQRLRRPSKSRRRRRRQCQGVRCRKLQRQPLQSFSIQADLANMPPP